MIALTQIFPNKNNNKAIAISLPEFNYKKLAVFFVIFALSLFLISLVFYVFQINELTKGSYVIKNYEKEVSNLTEENAKLQMNFANVSFLGQMQEKTQELSFEKIKEIKYIQVLESSLAKAK